MKKLSGPEREKAERTLDVLESNIKRLNRYVSILAKIRLP
jgi:hypothetical protein